MLPVFITQIGSVRGPLSGTVPEAHVYRIPFIAPTLNPFQMNNSIVHFCAHVYMSTSLSLKRKTSYLRGATRPLRKFQSRLPLPLTKVGSLNEAGVTLPEGIDFADALEQNSSTEQNSFYWRQPYHIE